MDPKEIQRHAMVRRFHRYTYEVGHMVRATGEVVKTSAIAAVGGTVYQNGVRRQRRGGLPEVIFPHSFANARHRYLAEPKPYPLRRELPISAVDIVRDFTAFGGALTLLAHNETFPLAAIGTAAIILATNFGIAFAGEVMSRRG